MQAATIEVEWARTFAELRARTTRQKTPAPAVIVMDLELPEVGVDTLLTLVVDSFPLAQVVALGGDLTGERGAKLLSQGVPSLTKPVCPAALAALALRMSLESRADASPESKQRSTHLESVFNTYSTERVLSKQQQMILRLYLSGMSDKEIAHTSNCSEATIYEHWRRMARKAGGSHKGDAIADFHRFLGGD